MFNFTKKHSNALVDLKEQTTVRKNYEAAIKKIELLEDELNQKTLELNRSYHAQHRMSEDVKNCVISLYTVHNQLQAVAAHLECSNQQISELTQENSALRLSGDEWFKRAIKLEFDVLTANDGLKRVENERDLAIKMCELLQSADKENSRGGNQD
jgi:prefoldin subunit 5